MVHGRGNANNVIIDILRQISERLGVIETSQRRGVHLEYFCDDKEVTPNPNLEPGV